MPGLASPFVPVFGGAPGAFMGRHDIVSRFSKALSLEGNGDLLYRTLFLSGMRGVGKTTLLRRLVGCAREREWTVYELDVENAVSVLARRLAGYDELVRDTRPQGSVSILGNGVSLGGVGETVADRILREDLSDLLAHVTVEERSPTLIVIDEIQKMRLDEVAFLSRAFQRASSDGGLVALVFAGLPEGRERIIHHDGCTFLRRMYSEELELFSYEEVRDDFSSILASVDGLDVSDEVVDALLMGSQGHPFLLQLIGAAAIGAARPASGRFILEMGDVGQVLSVAKADYGKMALSTMFEELPSGVQRYVRAFAEAAGDGFAATNADAAKVLGVAPSSVSKYLGDLKGRGWLKPYGRLRGFYAFTVPYFAEWLRDAPQREVECQPRLAEWNSQVIDPRLLRSRDVPDAPDDGDVLVDGDLGDDR